MNKRVWALGKRVYNTRWVDYTLFLVDEGGWEGKVKEVGVVPRGFASH